MSLPHASIFPPSVRLNAADHLEIAGCDAVTLAERFGTPLYVYDEGCIRAMCREFRAEFSSRYPDLEVVYAGKSYMGAAIAALVAGEGLGLDVVSGGEIAIAQAAGFPLERAYFHGNNKGRDELEQALAAGVGMVVIDNFHEIDLLGEVADQAGIRQPCLLRLSPDVDPHTHEKTTTGTLDSKFGFAIATGQAEEAVERVLAVPVIDLRGFHFHLGSPIYEVEPYEQATATVAEFALAMHQRHGLVTRHFSPGGGYAIQYTDDEPAPPIEAYAEAITRALKESWDAARLPLPRLSVEPGRSIVGRAGVALYTVGSTKEITGLRRYVSVDGGMGDNIRPALYGSRYEAILANRTGGPIETVTVAGKYCESGDILIKDLEIQRPEAGDILAVPAAGAYCLAMASNYNHTTRPAVVFVEGGEARLVRRREAYADLLTTEVGLE
jgi:diaminopimelate decarboxylase